MVNSPSNANPIIKTMKKTIAFLTLTAFAALPLVAADLADDIKSAAKKLSEKPNYSWTTKSDSVRPTGQGGQGGQEGQRRGGGGGNRFGGGFGGGSEGKIDKDGLAVLTYRFGENTSQVIVKSGKVAVKSGDEWKTAEELADAGDGGGEGNRRGGGGRFMARSAQNFKAPATTAQELAGKITGIKKDGDVYTGELTAEAIKEMNTFRGGRPGGNNENAPPAPDTSGLKGTVKFWVTDGVLTKYEQNTQGKMKFREEDRDVNRTTTVEIKDIGTTKMDVPAEAKKKLTAN